MDQRIILLADDDADDRDMFCEALSEIDDRIHCNCAVNGLELMRQLETLTTTPELIFLDLNMPMINGFECLKLLKENEHYKHIPVIVISTSSHQEEMNMVAELGAFSYFVKPTDFNELTKSLRVLVNTAGV